jgi:hypothetical protein
MSTITIDQKILDLFNVINKQKQEVEQAELEVKQSWKTKCSIEVDWTSTPINIQTINEQGVHRVHADLLMKHEYYKKSCDILGCGAEFKWGGYSLEDWQQDLKKRLAVIQVRTKKDNLAELEKRLNSIVSPEQKRQMELDAITSQLLNS